MNQRRRLSSGSIVVGVAVVAAVALAVFFVLHRYFPVLYPFDIPNQ
jgi:hypothetical protein